MNIRLGAGSLDFYVDIRLRGFHGRWLAVAAIGGEHEIGFARDPRQAIAASLASLGAMATAALLADPQLLVITKQTDAGD